jgi:hypothetical protein
MKTRLKKYRVYTSIETSIEKTVYAKNIEDAVIKASNMPLRHREYLKQLQANATEVDSVAVEVVS